MKTPPTEKRATRINICMRPDLLARLDAAVLARGWSRSQFIAAAVRCELALAESVNIVGESE